MTVGNYNLNQIWLQISKYQAQLNLAVVVVLSLYLLAYAAELTWRLIPSGEMPAAISSAAPTSAAAIKKSNQRVDLAALKRLNLFGDLTAEPADEAPVAEAAPETNLKLTLTGVVASSDAEVAAAIIESKGNQNTYGINEKIEGTNALLKEVFADRVIIRNGSRRETLMLDGIDFSSNGSTQVREAAPQPKPASSRTRPRVVSREAAEATRQLRNKPAEFSDYIAISPYRRDGQLQGYRISPGRKPELFKSAGFQPGDIVTEINGLDLTDPMQSREAMTSLREAQSLQLTVNRGEETLTLYLDFPSAGLDL